MIVISQFHEKQKRFFFRVLKIILEYPYSFESFSIDLNLQWKNKNRKMPEMKLDFVVVWRKESDWDKDDITKNHCKIVSRNVFLVRCGFFDTTNGPRTRSKANKNLSTKNNIISPLLAFCKDTFPRILNERKFDFLFLLLKKTPQNIIITFKKFSLSSIVQSSIYEIFFCIWHFRFHFKVSHCVSGNGLIDETEFLHWIARIQALRDTDPAPEDDDLTQDLVAAFRWEGKSEKY